jgi:hypothetical protein
MCNKNPSCAEPSLVHSITLLNALEKCENMGCHLECGLLGCSMLSSGCILTSLWNILPPSLRSKWKGLSGCLVHGLQERWPIRAAVE